MFFGRRCNSLLVIGDSYLHRSQSTLVEKMKGALKEIEEPGKTEEERQLKLDSELDEQGNPFRKFFVMPDRKLRVQQEIVRLTGRTLRRSKPKFDLHERNAVRRPRCEEMETDQDWPTVWPVAASFRSSVVPIPVRMGTRKDPEKKPPFKTVGNLELVKIPNFLHLTPGAIERHCNAIRKFCTDWPHELDNSVKMDETDYPVIVSFSDYVHQGTSLRDSRSRIVTIKVKLSTFGLNDAAKDKMMRLIGDRYCRETDILTLVTDRCYSRKQNLDYAMYLLTVLYHESNKVEAWERLIQRQDHLKIQFAGSKSQKIATRIAEQDKEESNVRMDALNDQKDRTVEEKVKRFGDVWEKYRNEEETPETVSSYAEAVKDLLSISPLTKLKKAKNQ